MQFTTFKDAHGNWWWHVSKNVGPAIVYVAISGHFFPTQQAAIAEFKQMSEWIIHGSTPPVTK